MIQLLPLYVSFVCSLLLAACAAGALPAPTPTPLLTRAPGATPAPNLFAATPSTPLGPPVGYLEGKVSIGPYRPVEQSGSPPATIPPEVFAARSIHILQSDGKTLLTNVRISSDGTYRVTLTPGNYVVALPPPEIEVADGLPKKIAIESGKTLRLNISIDTGVR